MATLRLRGTFIDVEEGYDVDSGRSRTGEASIRRSLWVAPRDRPVPTEHENRRHQTATEPRVSPGAPGFDSQPYY